MTRSIAHEIASRTGAIRRPRTMAGALAARFYALAPDETAQRSRWPSPEYREDPVRFFREVLGVEPWKRQIEVCEAIRDNPRVGVRSGHKVSKSNTIAGIGLWFYCSFDDARVVMSSTTGRQVDGILWRELRMMRARAKVRIDGELNDLARSGFKALDFREIVGFTAREAEAAAGISGKNLLYLLDEASGIPQAIFEAIEGNRAGGARVAMFGNPTRTEGEFFDAFYSKSKFYSIHTISSEETPNAITGEDVIPGLATKEWIDEKREEWGEDSPLYKIRVKGVHVLSEEGRIISVHAITEAEKRWHETPEEGALFIGLDPSGPGEDGDECAMAPRRGLKVLEIIGWYGLTEDGIVAHLLGLLDKHRKPREIPIVNVDALGQIGFPVYQKLRAIAHEREGKPGAFEVYGIRVSDAAIREPQIYDRLRDELWANGARWFKEGGAIPEDTKLAKDLNAPKWHAAASFGRRTSLLKATDKKELKKLLGRSTDRGDAVLLSVWEPLAVRQAREIAEQDDYDEREEDRPQLDPYAAPDVWR